MNPFWIKFNLRVGWLVGCGMFEGISYNVVVYSITMNMILMLNFDDNNDR